MAARPNRLETPLLTMSDISIDGFFSLDGKVAIVTGG